MTHRELPICPRCGATLREVELGGRRCIVCPNEGRPLPDEHTAQSRDANIAHEIPETLRKAGSGIE